MTTTRCIVDEEETVERQRTSENDNFSSPQNPNRDDDERKKKRLKMVCACSYLPKIDPGKPLGEDSHFICSDAQIVGVADGVGGWAEYGIDSGEYARDLMTNASLAVEEGASPVDPAKVLRKAYRRTAKSKLKGSSTACVVSHSDGVLRSANVGDSGFMVFRGNRLIYRSETQQRGFNCPLQLGNSKGCDRPESAVVAEVSVETGDVVVLCTDGFLDNVFADEVEEILERGMVVMEAENMALLMAQIAYFNSFNRFRDTPFSVNARKAGEYHKGGKVDDITVVVCLIVERDADEWQLNESELSELAAGLQLN